MIGRTISELNTMLSPVAWSSRRTSPSGRPAYLGPLALFDRLTAPLAGNPVATQPARTSTIMRRRLPGHRIAPALVSRAITTRWPSMR